MPAPAVTGAASSFGGAMGGGGGMSLLERTAMEDDERASRPDSTAISMDGMMGGQQAFAPQGQVRLWAEDWFKLQCGVV